MMRRIGEVAAGALGGRMPLGLVRRLEVFTV